MTSGISYDIETELLITGSITGVAQTIELTSPNSGTEVIQLVGTWVGSIVVEGSNDGTNYVLLPFIVQSTGLLGSTITSNGAYLAITNGYNQTRIRSSAWTSGTANIKIYGSNQLSFVYTQTTNSNGVVDKTAFVYGTDIETPIGGVYQDASPALTAGTSGAVRLTQNRAIHTNLRNDAGTAISSSVNDAVNNELILDTKTPDTTTPTVALGALNAFVSIPAEGLTGVGFQILAGTLIGTITPEVSIDGGVNWFPASFYDAAASSTFTSIVFTSNNTSKLLTLLTLGGTTHARVRVSSYTSGTANTLMSASHGVSISLTPSGASGGAQAFGTITNTFPSIPNNVATLIIAANPSRKYLSISNGSGSLALIQMGTGAGLSTTTGIPIPARTFYELKGDNLYTGPIYAFSSSSITFSLGEGTP